MVLPATVVGTRTFSGQAAMTDNLSPLELLQRARAVSGLSLERFARELMVRDLRTVERWLAGGVIPEVCLEKLQSIVDAGVMAGK